MIDVEIMKGSGTNGKNSGHNNCYDNWLQHYNKMVHSVFENNVWVIKATRFQAVLNQNYLI